MVETLVGYSFTSILLLEMNVCVLTDIEAVSFDSLFIDLLVSTDTRLLKLANIILFGV